MPTKDERISLITPKLDRAKKHFADLKISIDKFVSDPDLYVVETNNDVKTGELIYYVSRVLRVPLEVPLLIGDALHNCRAALDHLAYQLVLLNGGTPTKNTCYPIFESAAVYHSTKARRVCGMRQDAIDLIDATKPYKGGSDDLWILHQLNNIDTRTSAK